MLKKVFCVWAVLLLQFYAFCQHTLCTHNNYNVDDELLSNSNYSLVLNKKADQYIQDMLEVAGLPMNFVVQKIPYIKNAIAYMDSTGTRYILYDNKFLNSLVSDSTNTEFVTVLSHEIGHHLAGHTLNLENYFNPDSCEYWCNPSSNKYSVKKKVSFCSEYLSNSRKNETEADVIAGYLMARLNYDISNVKNTFNQLPSVLDEKLSTHPSLQTRISSIDRGYAIAKEKNHSLTSLLMKIRKDSIQIKLKYIERAEKKRLIDQVRLFATVHAIGILNNKTPIRLKTNSTLYPDDRVDNDRMYQEYFGVTLEFQEVDVIKIKTKFKMKIENSMLSLFAVKDDAEKVVYSSIFNEGKISFEEIANIFSLIYERILREELESK